MGLYDEVGVPAAVMHVPTEGEGLTMAEEIAPLERGRAALRPRGRGPPDPGGLTGPVAGFDGLSHRP